MHRGQLLEEPTAELNQLSSPTSIPGRDHSWQGTTIVFTSFTGNTKMMEVMRAYFGNGSLVAGPSGYSVRRKSSRWRPEYQEGGDIKENHQRWCVIELHSAALFRGTMYVSSTMDATRHDRHMFVISHSPSVSL